MKELKIFLLNADLTQIEVARRLGITRQYLHDIFRGKRKALHIRARLVEELGFPAAQIDYPFVPRKKAA